MLLDGEFVFCKLRRQNAFNVFESMISILTDPAVRLTKIFKGTYSAQLQIKERGTPFATGRDEYNSYNLSCTIQDLEHAVETGERVAPRSISQISAFSIRAFERLEDIAITVPVFSIWCLPNFPR